MPKSIVILFDGTSNEIEADRTNILRLYGCLRKTAGQVVWYDPGVGTLAAPDNPFPLVRKTRELAGLATGYGLDRNVKEAYRFLAQTYDPGDGTEEGRDRLYFFGFSRGAYTARVLAGFIHAVGLIEPRNLNLLDYAFRAYKRIGEGGEAQANAEAGGPYAEVRLYERMLRAERPPIRALGLFDTVASMIEFAGVWPRLRKHAFTRSNTSVAAVRHAVAIDERRTMFQPQLWPGTGPDGKPREYRFNRFDPRTARPQDIKEVWFRGVHADIGGGYPETNSALAKLPLKWLIDETRALGLDYSTRTVNTLVLGKDGKHERPDENGPVSTSLKGLWRAVEWLPRRVPAEGRPDRLTFGGWYLPRGEARVIPPDAPIHESVFDRSTPDGLPETLPPSPKVEPWVRD